MLAAAAACHGRAASRMRVCAEVDLGSDMRGSSTCEAAVLHASGSCQEVHAIHSHELAELAVTRLVFDGVPTAIPTHRATTTSSRSMRSTAARVLSKPDTRRVPSTCCRHNMRFEALPPQTSGCCQVHVLPAAMRHTLMKAKVPARNWMASVVTKWLCSTACVACTMRMWGERDRRMSNRASPGHQDQWCSRNELRVRRYLDQMPFMLRAE